MDEFLCQVAFYVTLDPTGARHVKALIQDPRPQTNGKTTDALISFALEHVVSPRACGHKGILLFHCTFDRAPFESLSRLLNQYYTWMAPTIETEGDGPSATELYLLFWFLKTSCTHHDAHKALEWSMFGQFHSTELMDEVYVGIASCCNSSMQIVGEMQRWIWDSIVPAPLDQLPPCGKLARIVERAGLPG